MSARISKKHLYNAVVVYAAAVLLTLPPALAQKVVDGMRQATGKAQVEEKGSPESYQEKTIAAAKKDAAARVIKDVLGAKAPSGKKLDAATMELLVRLDDINGNLDIDENSQAGNYSVSAVLRVPDLDLKEFLKKAGFSADTDELASTYGMALIINEYWSKPTDPALPVETTFKYNKDVGITYSNKSLQIRAPSEVSAATSGTAVAVAGRSDTAEVIAMRSGAAEAAQRSSFAGVAAGSSSRVAAVKVVQTSQADLQLEAHDKLQIEASAKYRTQGTPVQESKIASVIAGVLKDNGVDMVDSLAEVLRFQRSRNITPALDVNGLQQQIDLFYDFLKNDTIPRLKREGAKGELAYLIIGSSNIQDNGINRATGQWTCTGSVDLRVIRVAGLNATLGSGAISTQAAGPNTDACRDAVSAKLGTQIAMELATSIGDHWREEQRQEMKRKLELLISVKGSLFDSGRTRALFKEVLAKAAESDVTDSNGGFRIMMLASQSKTFESDVLKAISSDLRFQVFKDVDWYIDGDTISFCVPAKPGAGCNDAGQNAPASAKPKPSVQPARK